MYTNDSLEYHGVGIHSDKVYPTRGLRQGCNFSPLLFALYLVDLSEALNKTNQGILLWDTYLSHLIFADDLAIVTETEEQLQNLLGVLNEWCENSKMIVSIEKSKVVSTSEEGAWPVLDLDFEYKYSLKTSCTLVG